MFPELNFQLNFFFLFLIFQYENAKNLGFNKNFYLKKEEASARNDHELVDRTKLYIFL